MFFAEHIQGGFAKVKKLVLVVTALAVIALVVGCGGGGGKGGGDKGSYIHGSANINSASEHPKIACLDRVNGSWRTLTVASLPLSAGGWRDVEFNVRVPAYYSGMVITVVVFNDLDHDNVYDSSEVLGFMPHFLEWDGVGHYVIAESGTVYCWDALSADLYINCTFTRDGPSDPNAIDDAKKAAAQRQ